MKQQLYNKVYEGTSYQCSDDCPDESRALIFIHGVGMNSNVWHPQAQYFTNNYRVITYDFLGHGHSATTNQDLTIDDYVEQLYRLTKHLNVSKCCLVGHSMGALIGVAFALKYENMVNSMVALNMVFNRTKEAQDSVLKRAEMVISSANIANIDSTLVRWFKNNTSAEDKVKIDIIRKYFNQLSPKSYGKAYKLFALSDKIFINRLSELLMPVLYITGDNDNNSTTQMSIDMAKLTPKGVSMSLPGESHMMAYISSNKVNSKINEFINEHIN